MYIRKVYGQSRPDNCPFCGKPATSKNMQGVPVCQAHREKLLSDMKCICGEWLDVRSGKFGAYFHCMNCGNISYYKGIEMNPGIKQAPAATNPTQAKKHIVITSDEVDFL